MAYAHEDYDTINPEAARLRARLAPAVQKVADTLCAVNLGAELIALLTAREVDNRVAEDLPAGDYSKVLRAAQKIGQPAAFRSVWDHDADIARFIDRLRFLLASDRVRPPSHPCAYSEANTVRNGGTTTGKGE